MRKSGSEARLTSTAEYQYYNLSVDTLSIWYAKKSENHKSVPVVCRTHSLMGGASRPTDAATALLADFTNHYLHHQNATVFTPAQMHSEKEKKSRC